VAKNRAEAQQLLKKAIEMGSRIAALYLCFLSQIVVDKSKLSP
jgi:hypothetical protein